MEGQFSVGNGPLLGQVKEFPLAAAFAAAVIMTVGLSPLSAFRCIPDDLGVRADQSVIPPSLQLFTAGCIQHLIVLPFVSDPHSDLSFPKPAGFLLIIYIRYDFPIDYACVPHRTCLFQTFPGTRCFSLQCFCQKGKEDLSAPGIQKGPPHKEAVLSRKKLLSKYSAPRKAETNERIRLRSHQRSSRCSWKEQGSQGLRSRWLSGRTGKREAAHRWQGCRPWEQ